MYAPASGARLPFKLLRWFSLASFALIAAIAAINAHLISSFVTTQLLEREGQVTRDFVQNILVTDHSIDYLVDIGNAELRQRFRDSVLHFTATHDILRTNVYLPDGTILWSSDRSIVGKKFPNNDELQQAIKGTLVVESGPITREIRNKPEHVGLPMDSEFFVETYIPVTRAEGGAPVGAVEIYKAPVALTSIIVAGQRRVWLAAGLGALILYLTLFWIVRRADRTIRRQHEQLLGAETIAATADLSSSMAHNIRNPLASIRSSAELCIVQKGEDHDEQARDIIHAVDRIEAWIQELLRYTRNEAQAQVPVDIGTLVNRAFEECAPEFVKRGITGSVSDHKVVAKIRGDATILAQILHSVISNAMDATPVGGKIEGSVRRSPNAMVSVCIADTGHGIAQGNVQNVFRPFFTTKKEGLGLGLPLARRQIERMGGLIHIQSAPGAGTTVRMDLPEL